MRGPEEQALDIQRQWAESRSIALSEDRRAFVDPADALFAGSLRADTRREFSEGDGRELRRLHRLKSSSCLAINVFEPWRDDPEPLAQALGESASTMTFEKKQRTRLGGIPPNLDVFLSGAGPVAGVECKFLEPYGAEANEFRSSYFAKPGLWDGHPDLEDLARRIHAGEERFERLKAAQLIKHALGLQSNQPQGFVLRLVWYRLDHPLADQVQAEIDRFAAQVTTIDFAAVTYQHLVTTLAAAPEPAPGYFAYIADRYGLAT